MCCMASPFFALTPPECEALEALAARYVWWKTPAEAIRYPQHVAAQVMNIADYEDVQRLTHALSLERLRGVLQAAAAGQFTERSWHYWHYRLGLAKVPQDVPPLPPRIVE
jgi:hypothetical protein